MSNLTFVPRSKKFPLTAPIIPVDYVQQHRTGLEVTVTLTFNLWPHTSNQWARTRMWTNCEWIYERWLPLNHSKRVSGSKNDTHAGESSASPPQSHQRCGALRLCVSMSECFVLLVALCWGFGALIWQPACPSVWLLFLITLCCSATARCSVLFWQHVSIYMNVIVPPPAPKPVQARRWRRREGREWISIRRTGSSFSNISICCFLLLLYLCVHQKKMLPHRLYKKAQVLANSLLDTRGAKCVNWGLFSEAD